MVVSRLRDGVQLTCSEDREMSHTAPTAVSTAKKFTLEVKSNLGVHINVPTAAIQALMEEYLLLISVALGSFILQVTGQVKGSSSRGQQRVKVRAATGFEHIAQGVKLIVQPGDNSTCMEATLFVPHTCQSQAAFTVFCQQFEAAIETGKPQFTEEHLREHVQGLQQQYQAAGAEAQRHARAYEELEAERSMHAEELARLRAQVTDAERQIGEVEKKLPPAQLERERTQKEAEAIAGDLHEMETQLAGLQEARVQRALAVVGELLPSDSDLRRDFIRRLQEKQG